MIMPFGKHAGTLVQDLPLPYLLWLSDRPELRDPLKSFVYQALDKQANEPEPLPPKPRKSKGKPATFTKETAIILVKAGLSEVGQQYRGNVAAAEIIAQCWIACKKKLLYVVFCFVSIVLVLERDKEISKGQAWHSNTKPGSCPFLFV